MFGCGFRFAKPPISTLGNRSPPLPWDLGLGTWDLHVPPTLTLRQWRMTEHKEVPPGSVPQGRRWLQLHSDIQRSHPPGNSPAGSRRSRSSGWNPGCAACGGGSSGVTSPRWYSSRHPARVPPACRDPGRVVWGPPWCQGCGLDVWARLRALPGSRCVGWVGEGGWCPLVPRPLGTCCLWGVRCGVGAGGFGACSAV